MNKTSRFLILLLMAGVMLFIGCEDPTATDTSGGGGGGGGGSSDTVTESDAAEVAAGAMTAVNTAVSSALSEAAQQAAGNEVGSQSISASNTLTIDYSGTGVRVTGNMQSSNDGSFSYTMTVALNNHSSSSGNVTGELTVSGSYGGSGGYTGSYDGDFTVSSNTTTYTVSIDWNLNSSGQFSGSYAVNGQTFTYDGGGSGGGTGGGGDSGDGGSGGGSVTSGISVWTSDSSPGYIDVYINGSYRGRLTSYFTSRPQYGQSGTITVDLPVGTHSISAERQDGATMGPTSFSLTSSRSQLLFEIQR